MKVDLIIFDFDGVIADSETLANQILADRLTGIGCATTLEDAFEHYLGRSWADCVTRFEALWRRPGPDDLRAQVDAEIERRLPELKPVQGAPEFIRSCRAYARCIASSSTPEWIERRLQLLELSDQFPGAIFSTARHVRRGKPHPDIYLHAMQAMGASADSTLVIEDSVTGVAAAAASGAFVVGLCAGSHVRPGHADRLMAAGAHAICDDFDKVHALMTQGGGRSFSRPKVSAC